MTCSGSEQEAKVMISVRPFAILPNGGIVHCYSIENSHGEIIELLDYGAAIHAVFVRDRYGMLEDCVLGAPDGEHLLTCTYLGSTIGRCANRIAYGRYSLDGRDYQLEQNLFGHFLHGASGNYAMKLFSADVNQDKNTVTFSFLDTGEGGFDCNVRVAVQYSFGDDSRLVMTTTMIPDGATILNPTNHTYFHLGAKDIRTLRLQIRAKSMVTRGEMGLPDGGLRPVSGTPADFTEEKCIGEAMSDNSDIYFNGKAPGFDEFYFLDRHPGTPAAVLTNPENGRVLRIYTDMPSLVFFAGGTREAEPGKNGTIYEGYCGTALEPEFIPNAVNCPEYDSPIYRIGEKLISRTIYEFDTEKER